jgi:hypothetical protein
MMQLATAELGTAVDGYSYVQLRPLFATDNAVQWYVVHSALHLLPGGRLAKLVLA